MRQVRAKQVNNTAAELNCAKEQKAKHTQDDTNSSQLRLPPRAFVCQAWGKTKRREPGTPLPMIRV